MEEVNKDKSESADRRYPTREQEELDRLTYAQKVQQKVGHSKILGANQMPTRGTKKLGMTRNQKLMTRHQKLRSNQTTSCGTMWVATESFAQVMKEQEHNLFTQTVRCMTRIYYLEKESVVMAQIMEQVMTKYNLAQ